MFLTGIPDLDRRVRRAHTGAVATQISLLLNQSLSSLRYEPTPKRVRAYLDGTPVLDSTRALLVWEPRRIVPIYAVPEADLLANLSVSGAARLPKPEAGRKVLTPDDDFALHTAAGTALDIEVSGHAVPAAAYRPDDAELSGVVLVDFRAFDWFEEDVPIDSHPRDPFHRVDIMASTRHIRVELEGMHLADSAHPMMLFETHLPARYYLPRQDVAWDALVATERTSKCPYKGTASYWAPASGGREVAWCYREPLPESAAIAGLVCFYDERTDFIIDGQRQAHPQTPFS